MVKKVWQSLKVVEDRQKSYADKKRTYQEFQVCDLVYVWVNPKRKFTLRWGKCAKIAPRFCGTSKILERIGLVAYQLALSSDIQVHNVFHVCLLKKNIYDSMHIINWQDIQVKGTENGKYKPLHIYMYVKITTKL